MTNRHVESFELLKQEVKGSFLLQVLVVPPFNQDNLGHHELEENIQEDPGQKSFYDCHVSVANQLVTIFKACT